MNHRLRKPSRTEALLACAVALVATGSTAWAQSQTGSIFPSSATLICRPATANENATATVMSTSALLVCRPFAARMHMQDGSVKVIGDVRVTATSGPDFSNALTPQQIDAAYNSWLETALKIDPEIRHTP